MSRTRKAVIAAGFGYVQFGLALIIGIVLVPLILDRLGARTWGLWLATGELLAYAGMVDLGVLGVLPWLLAEADGKRDRDGMRRLISSGVAVGAIIGFAYALIAFALWQALPSVLRLTAADRAALGPPLTLIVAGSALTYPLRIFPAALIGLQDMKFHGAIRIGQSVLNVAVTVVLLLQGYGLYALAWASIVPTLAGVIASAVRLRAVAPDLMTSWTRPAPKQLTPLIIDGFGVWLGGFGWLLLSSSNALVITFLGHPEWAPIFSCTAKISVAATQLVWLTPDSGLVGLAQLHGEANARPRVVHLVGVLQQVHLLLAGAAACALLAFNPTFVTHWVGGAMFGGLTLNALLAVGVVLYSLVHGVVSTASIVGSRVQVGILTVVNGLVQLAAAIVLGRWMGLPGVALAGLVAACLTSLPVGLVLLTRAIDFSPWRLAADRVGPWARRMLPTAVTAMLIGVFREWLGFWLAATATGVVLLAYVWQMRPMYEAVLALDPGWTRWLAMVRLAPPLQTDPGSAPLPVVNRS